MNQRLRTVLEAHRLLGGDDQHEVDLGPLRPPADAVITSSRSEVASIGLPPPAEQLTMTLTGALWARSSRTASPHLELHARSLSTVLRMAAGPQRLHLPGTAEAGPGGHRRGRMAMAPSAGGLASLDVHVVTQRIVGVPPGCTSTSEPPVR